MEQILISLAQQAPSALAVIIVVVYFLNALQKRDEQFFKLFSELTERLGSLETAFTEHDTSMRAGIDDMHRAVIKRDTQQRRQSAQQQTRQQQAKKNRNA